MAGTRRTAFPLLALLAERPMSGYDLKKGIEATFGHFWAESYGQIYPELKRLQAAGLVTIRSQAASPAGSSGQGAPRRDYALTTPGRDHLTAWLQEPVRVQVQRNELLLKLYVAAGSQPGLGLRHVAEHRQSLLMRLNLLQRIEERLRRVLPGSPGLAGWLAGVRHGVLVTEAGLRWCDEAEALLGPALSPSS